MRLKAAALFLTSLILFIPMLTLSCDRLIIITGTVYEWVNAPAGSQSKIYHKEYTTGGLLQEDIPIDIELLPTRGALVNYSGKIKENKSYSGSQIPDSQGEFRLAISLGQNVGDFTTTLYVSGSGYYPASRDIVDSGSSHSVNAVLVKKK
jgi:hypothetical protein